MRLANTSTICMGPLCLFRMACWTLIILALLTSVGVNGNILVVESLLNMTETYNRFEPPFPANGEPIDLKLSVLVREVSEVDEHSSSVTMTMFLREYWQDPRITVNPKVFEDGDLAMADTSLVKKFWMPDLYIWNLRRFRVHEMHRRMESLQVFKDGTIRHSTACEMTVVCPMDFRLYPFDVQNCHVEFTSYSYGAKLMTFSWRNDPALKLEESWNQLPQFEVTMEANPDTIIRTPGIAQFAHLRLEITLSRKIRPYILQTYLPSALFVVVSWVSFIVSAEVVPGRMVLLVTTLLTLVTMYSSVRANAPRSNSLKSIEVWLVTCIIFVFCALLEYALILFLTFRRKMAVEKAKSKAQEARLVPAPLPSIVEVGKSSPESIQLEGLRGATGQSTSSSPPGGAEPKKKWIFEKLLSLDGLALVIFPTAFLIFNIAYWACYMTEHNSLLA